MDNIDDELFDAMQDWGDDEDACVMVGGASPR